MRLGTETGSVINHVHSRAVIGQPEPVVGMGATVLLWTDRHAATIVSVQKLGADVFVSVQHDRARVVAGNTMDGSAEYEFEPNRQGRLEHFRSRNGGAWQQVVFAMETQRWRKSATAHGLRIGARDEYRDPSF